MGFLDFKDQHQLKVKQQLCRNSIPTYFTILCIFMQKPAT